MYLWIRRTFLTESELWDSEEDLVGGSKPAVEVDVDDLMATRNKVVQGLECSRDSAWSGKAMKIGVVTTESKCQGGLIAHQWWMH